MAGLTLPPENPTSAHYIATDAKGVPWVNGTGYKVRELVEDYLAHGWSPAEIRAQHYNELTLAQIHAAFAYYYDHKSEIDAEIQRVFAASEAERLAEPPTPFEQKGAVQGSPR